MATKVELQDQVEQLEALLEEALEPFALDGCCVVVDFVGPLTVYPISDLGPSINTIEGI